MQRRHTAFAIAAFVLSATACGGGGLSQEDTARAMAAMSQSLAAAEAAASASASGGSVTATATCSGGGSISIHGAWTNAQSFSIDLVVDACSEAGIVIDGNLHYAATTNGTSVSMSMDGQLSFSGAIDGTCGIDVDMEITQSSVSIHGSMCGHDVSASSP